MKAASKATRRLLLCALLTFSATVSFANGAPSSECVPRLEKLDAIVFARGTLGNPVLITPRLLIAKYWPSVLGVEGEYFIYDKVTLKKVGEIQLHYNEGSSAHLALEFYPEEQGKGFGTEAKLAVIRFTFATTTAQDIFAKIKNDNEASIRLHVKLGFVPYRKSTKENESFYTLTRARFNTLNLRPDEETFFLRDHSFTFTKNTRYISTKNELSDWKDAAIGVLLAAQTKESTAPFAQAILDNIESGQIAYHLQHPEDLEPLLSYLKFKTQDGKTGDGGQVSRVLFSQLLILFKLKMDKVTRFYLEPHTVAALRDRD